jgi:Zn-dependent peptidase ImmA (M78 family)/transcriptional regulator with XRE-family HTH domain
MSNKEKNAPVDAGMKVQINPEVLVWARESAGLSLSEAADLLKLTTSTRSTSEEKLAAMEAGENNPTKNQLNAFANVYKRPLVTFYLATPPKKGQRGQDFRQTPDARSQRANAMLDTLLRDVKARQEMVRDILVDEDEFAAPDFIGSISVGDDIKVVAQRMSERLGFDYTDIGMRTGTPSALFSKLRKAAEEAGVFVLVLGDLGSHHSSIPASVFRGFAISDSVAPFVVINAKDARSARAFTLIHELVHLWLGQTGVSGNISTSTPHSEHSKIERFCNDVAGEFLLPEAYFRQAAIDFETNDLEAARECIDSVAGRWSVSEAMVAYRFQRRGEISANVYQTLRDEYEQRWLANLTRERETQGGPNGHVTKQFKLGNALVDVVYRGFRDKSLTHTKAAALLGSKAVSVPKFMDFVEDVRRNQRLNMAG